MNMNISKNIRNGIGSWELLLLAIIVYAIITNSILMAITFILIGMLGYVYAEREPRLIQMEINPDGVVVDKIMYEYDDLKSFLDIL